MVIGVVVTVTATITDWLCESVTVTFAVPAATALMVIVVVGAVAATGEVTVTTPGVSDVTVNEPV